MYLVYVVITIGLYVVYHPPLRVKTVTSCHSRCLHHESWSLRSGRLSSLHSLLHLKSTSAIDTGWPEGPSSEVFERAWAERERWWNLFILTFGEALWFVSCKQNTTFLESDVLLGAKYQSRITKWFQFKDKKLEDILWLTLPFQRNGDGRKCWKWHALLHDDQHGN